MELLELRFRRHVLRHQSGALRARLRALQKLRLRRLLRHILLRVRIHLLGRKLPELQPRAIAALSPMLKWALIFAIISVVAAVFGFGGVSEAAGDIAKIIFFVFLALCVLFAALAIFAANKLRGRSR
jgi:uncharacterized membrane protein YtjA (UPF0391 family)